DEHRDVATASLNRCNRAAHMVPVRSHPAPNDSRPLNHRSVTMSSSCRRRAAKITRKCTVLLFAVPSLCVPAPASFGYKRSPSPDWVEGGRYPVGLGVTVL